MPPWLVEKKRSLVYMVTSEYPHSGSGHKKNGHTAAWSPSIAASKHIFRALSNLDVGSDVPKEELDTVTDYIHNRSHSAPPMKFEGYCLS